MKQAIKKYLKTGKPDLTDSLAHRFKIEAGNELGRSAKSLVWKGIFNNIFQFLLVYFTFMVNEFCSQI